MRSVLSLVFAAATIASCSEDEGTLPVTQLLVRVHASEEVQLSANRLRITVNGSNVLGDRDVAQLRWPVDVPVLPQDAQRLAPQFELLVEALDGKGEAMARDRALTNFVREQQRVLDLRLQLCSPAQPVCDYAGCMGSACSRCVSGACVPVVLTPGSSLPALVPGAAVEQDPTPTCPDVSIRCASASVELCTAGRWQVREVCPHVCRNGACAGECTPGVDANRCSPANAALPQTCGQDGEWAANNDQLKGISACPFQCTAGACTGECEPGQTRCLQDTQQRCGTDGSWHDDRACAQFCSGRSCATAPSCAADDQCGDGQSCCRSLFVPGGTYSRSYDAREYTDPSSRASVSPFLLDVFEVSVERFRRWIAAYYQAGARPSPGAGRNENNPADRGWQEAWSRELPESDADLQQDLNECSGGTFGSLSSLPVNCVSWFVAQAFCIWDGGRLPTEAEWNFAAAGGDEQRFYPWSQPAIDTEISADRAVYSPALVSSVGSKPRGRGRWGHFDLSGNVGEWTQDWKFDDLLLPCDDCAALTPSGLKVVRGGSFVEYELSASASFRGSMPPGLPSQGVGFRCARTP